MPPMGRVLRWTGLVVAVLLVAAVTWALVEIGPHNLWGLWKYDTRQEGSLAVGHRAPDLLLTRLDGAGRENLLAGSGGRPLVLVFGSFT